MFYFKISKFLKRVISNKVPKTLMNFIKWEAVFPLFIVIGVGLSTKGLGFESLLCSAPIHKETRRPNMGTLSGL